MNQRKIAIAAVITTLVFMTALGLYLRRNSSRGAESRAGAQQGTIYYCPMHPTVTSHKPGNCPICGMKLVKRSSSHSTDVATQIANSAKSEQGIATVSLSPSQRVMANVKTMRVTESSESSELVTTGRVTFDERRVAQVTSYTAGRIERLHVNFTGDSVTRGEAVASIYSPDLYSTQREYMLALTNRERMRKTGFAQARSAADDLVDSTRRRLLLFGMTPSQIRRLASGGAPLSTTTITSPVSGIVTQKFVVTQQSVSAGQPLLQVADLSTVWIEADVHEADLSRIAVGQRVTVTSPALPAIQLPGSISFIQPTVGVESRATRVRIELPNRNLQLKPDMFVSVRLFGGTGRPVISLPVSAIVDRGQQQFVWVEVSPGNYSPRQVTAGSRTGDRVEIASGLQRGDIVVVEGNFLLDSEAQLRNAATQR